MKHVSNLPLKIFQKTKNFKKKIFENLCSQTYNFTWLHETIICSHAKHLKNIAFFSLFANPFGNAILGSKTPNF